MRLELIEEGAQNQRFLHHLHDGTSVEVVRYRGDTLCISTQVGCAVACPFCASGKNGLMRPLSLEEMCFPVRTLRSGLRRITLSGVGEPLHNTGAPAMLDWARQEGLALSLTTSGGPLKRLRGWLEAPHRGLTISVHAGTERTRTQVVPNAPALAPLFDTLHDVLPSLTNVRRKKTALAFLLVEGLNDSDAELDAFAERTLALTHPLRVHLYALNDVPGSPYRAVPRARYEDAYKRLSAAGLRVRMSSTARIEANGGCGTLVASRRRMPIVR